MDSRGRRNQRSGATPREPVHFLSGQEAKTKRRLGGLSGPPGRFASCLDLSQRQPGVIEEDGPASVSSTPRALRVMIWTPTSYSRSRI